ncbi:putative p21-activated kinase 3 [Trypanosoma theileri]|uniref:Putative p21-activated kinase 3 n=1 Tax=Trypanosoma theileri TaxID=67003 RepID=A0A1X0P5L8_9TRYP|nr:putative p21-activated kinase 3 [Trypanosoma theileri]ORC91943.1 putative p21-activated kinase 3 [Trypanosoma theileri]
MLHPSALLLRVIDPLPGENDMTFKVCIMNPVRPTVALTVVERTYNQCSLLCTRLGKFVSDRELPTLLGQSLFRGNDPTYVEARRTSVEVFLNSVVSHRLLCRDEEFLSLIGFEQAALLEQRKYEENLHHTRAEARCSDEWTIARRLITASSLSEDHDSNIIAARMWLRGTPFVFRSIVPSSSSSSTQLTRWRKTRIFVTDASIGTELLLVVQHVVTMAEIEVHAWQKILIGLNPTLFYDPLYVDVAASRVFAIYPIAPQGSLRDMLLSRRPFTTEKKQEREQIVKPLEVSQLQQLGRKILYILCSCHQYNISLPILSIGNLILSERHGLVLSDVEDILAGTCLFPSHYPYIIQEGNALLPQRTPFDILLFGVILLQLCGVCVDEQMLHTLLTCQGEPFISDSSEEDEETPRRSCHHIIARFTEIPLAIKNILFYIFHPTIPADLRVLAHHCFFNENELDSVDSFINPSTTSTAKMRRKEVELFHRSQDRWKERLETASEIKTRLEMEREHLLQLKQNGNKWQTRRKNLTRDLLKVETTSIVDDQVTSTFYIDESEICNPHPPNPNPNLPNPPPPLLPVRIKEVAVIGNQFKVSTTAPPAPPLPPMLIPRWV